MSKYNVKKTPVMPTEVNRMGEKAFKLSDKEELVSTVMTTITGNAVLMTFFCASIVGVAIGIVKRLRAK